MRTGTIQAQRVASRRQRKAARDACSWAHAVDEARGGDDAAGDEGRDGIDVGGDAAGSFTGARTA